MSSGKCSQWFIQILATLYFHCLRRRKKNSFHLLFSFFLSFFADFYRFASFGCVFQHFDQTLKFNVNQKSWLLSTGKKMADCKPLETGLPRYNHHYIPAFDSDDNNETTVENGGEDEDEGCPDHPGILRIVIFLTLLVGFCLLWSGTLPLSYFIPKSWTNNLVPEIHQNLLQSAQCALDVKQRLDCDPLLEADEQICHRRGCCWMPTQHPRSKSHLCRFFHLFPSFLDCSNPNLHSFSHPALFLSPRLHRLSGDNDSKLSKTFAPTIGPKKCNNRTCRSIAQRLRTGHVGA